MSSICTNAKEVVLYEFSETYFHKGLEILHSSTSTDDREELSSSLINSGNNILKYIGQCIKPEVASAKNDVIEAHDDVRALYRHIKADGNHDFTVMPTRCIPSIRSCLQHVPVDAIKTFNSIRKSYNIQTMKDYHITAEYYMEDTSSKTIKTKLKSSKKEPLKMNLIASIIDAAGCKHCPEDRHYNKISLSMELYILNLGYIFYQSYFVNLRYTNPKRLMFFFMIKLPDGTDKEYFSKNKILNLELCINNFDTDDDIICETFILSNNRNFSVTNVCKTLNKKVKTGLAKELYECLRENKIEEDYINRILTSFYVSGKGLGDFGQVFSVACLSYLEKGTFKGNCFLITIDSFLFIIAILIGCPVIIGTSKNFEYISIDDFLKYKNGTLFGRHNQFNSIQIYKDPAVPVVLDTDKLKKMIDDDQCDNIPNLCQAKIKFDEYIELSLSYFNNNPSNIYIKEVIDKEVLVKDKGSNYSLMNDSGQLLYYPDYFNNYKGDVNYEDNEEGKKIYLEVMKHTLYTQYYNLFKFLEYIKSNYYFPDWESNNCLKKILLLLETAANKKTSSSSTKNDNVFIVLADLYGMVSEIKKVNELYYDKALNGKNIENNIKKKKVDKQNCKDDYYFSDYCFLIIMTDIVKNATNPFRENLLTQREIEIYDLIKKNILSAWRLSIDTDRVDRVDRDSEPSDESSEPSFKNRLNNINHIFDNCTPIYYILNKFIEDLMDFINNFENLIYIIFNEITNYNKSMSDESLKNLYTYIKLFKEYKDVMFSNTFKEELNMLKNILIIELKNINKIIYASWKHLDQSKYKYYFLYLELKDKEDQANEVIKDDDADAVTKAKAESYLQKRYFTKISNAHTAKMKFEKASATIDKAMNNLSEKEANMKKFTPQVAKKLGLLGKEAEEKARKLREASEKALEETHDALGEAYKEKIELSNSDK